MKTTLLLGNPNTGKTSLFNTLTSSYAYVGNWTGVTVDKKVGQFTNQSGSLIDLPGVYDLKPVSEDESIVSNVLLHEDFDQLLNIMDASQLERSLHLTIQLLEMGKPVFIALNMMDVAKKKGMDINAERLASKLDVNLQTVIARKGTGCEELLEGLTNDDPSNHFQIRYPEEVENALDQFASLITNTSDISTRWLGLQFFAENNTVDLLLQKEQNYSQLVAIKQQLEELLQQPIQQVFYETRETFINQILKDVKRQSDQSSLLWQQRIDHIVMHPIWGIPIFMVVMFFVFQITFTWIGDPMSDLLDEFFSGTLSDWISQGLLFLGASSFVHDLIVDGIVAGVGGVLVFVPQIFALFFCISLLEDSGYMTRIAVIMDRIMEYFGLNGKSFIPMIISFGCNVPGIMAARTIEQRKERLLTILVAPFMSCSARLPVYALFIGAFFVKYQGLIVFSLYFLGILLALITVKIISMTVMRHEKSMFFVDLPVYHLPHAKTLWRSTWEKGKGFIRKAGTIIFAGSVFIWLMTYAGPGGLDVDMDTSFMAMIGGVIAPILSPLGFGTWQAASSLITGFLAKEVVVSAMSIIYAVTEGELGTTLSHFFTPVSAYSFMVFVLLYVPCLATVAAILRETKSVKWTIFAIVYPLVAAYIITWLIYRIGLALF
ncbi:ferrous iron transport protein B [Lentibacillus cibarius]|uniref:Ferrous iron transport protein B n=1 Tax=Lentibacillus cibarius TaxID=2583219 RepID=A0A549YI82_9BACI|nr:ferrous iron transport protein B [Lentibacillus cibarius]TRM11588.1 ferrous iron transport protein B [Lentibacillus cibarius]